MNKFIKPASDYTRDLDVVGNYKRDSAKFLSVRTGKPLAECLAWIERSMAVGGQLELKVPEVRCLHRGKNGDRTQQNMPYTQYLDDVTSQKWLFSPAMTIYEHPDVLPSLLSEYITGNIIGRSKVKQEGMDAKMAGNLELAAVKENEQTTYKIANNSLSGGQASSSTILYNKSAHSSLTSTCRTATSYGNANNEKFLAGNRHYWAPDIVQANIISIITHVDYKLIAEAVELYKLAIPTVDDVMELIEYSTHHYWRNKRKLANIRLLVEGLNDLERVAFTYVGDMHHLAKLNRDFFYTFLTRLSSKQHLEFTIPDCVKLIEGMDNDLKAFVSLLCTKELAGETIKTILELVSNGPSADVVFRVQTIAATVSNVHQVLTGYGLLIEAFWVTDNLPASVAHIRNSVRHIAITSDTDSTIFTVENWVEWYQGHIDFSETAFAIDYTIVYLATQSIIHVLAKLSTQLGVVPEKLNVLAMKNEYAFSVFSTTSMAKHYFAYMAAREGNVFKELEEEIKGVYLKDSNCPKEIMDQVTHTIKEIMDTVILGQKIKIVDLYQRIADIEEGIILSVRKGESKYLSRATVKTPDSYANPASSPYQHSVVWREGFSHKYGETPELPYPAIKVSLDTPNKTAFQNWLLTIKDDTIRNTLQRHYGDKSKVTTILLPRENVERYGLPTEVLQAMDIRKLVYSTVRPFYLILESLGIFLTNKNNTRLVSDFVREWKTPA